MGLWWSILWEMLISWGCGGQCYRSVNYLKVVVVSIIKVLISCGCGGQYYRSVKYLRVVVVSII